MKNIYKLLIISQLLCLQLVLNGQQDSKVKNNVITGNFTYSFQRPSGDLADRFGRNLEIGVGSEYVTYKKRYIFGIAATILFGNEVREDVLSTVTNDDGNLIGTNQQIGIVQLRERGYYIGGHVGKIFRTSEKSFSGIRFTLGAGLLSHKIRIQDDLRTVNILRGDNIKGFDRLTNGLTFHQFLGYQHYGKSGLFSVFGGLEAYEGFTMSRRSFDNTLMQRDTQDRVDILVGLKFGFIIKFNVTKNPEDIYY